MSPGTSHCRRWFRQASPAQRLSFEASSPRIGRSFEPEHAKGSLAVGLGGRTLGIPDSLEPEVSTHDVGYLASSLTADSLDTKISKAHSP